MTIAVFGAEGRVGSKVCLLAQKRNHTVVPIEKNTSREYVTNLHGIDAVIDFSEASATEEVCNFCKAHRCLLVTGVTGRDEKQQNLVDALSKELPVVASSNFSEGIAVLSALAETASKLLADWDCEIVEIHRRSKRDAPSGTAKNLAATIAKGKNFKQVTVHSLRCGSNFGQHTLVFATQGESLTLTHQAENTDIFAKGAIVRAEKLYGLAQNVADTQGIGTVESD